MVQKYVGPSALISELDTLKIQQHDKREYVLYKDYATLEAENEVLRETIKQASEVIDKAITDSIGEDVPGSIYNPLCDLDDILNQARKEVDGG